MTALQDLLDAHVHTGNAPGAVALVARGDDVEVATAGSADLDGSAPMARDSIFRLTSITKPITAAAVLTLVQDGRIALDAPIAEWLPEHLFQPPLSPRRTRPGLRPHAPRRRWRTPVPRPGW